MREALGECKGEGDEKGEFGGERRVWMRKERFDANN
jgi:hypothetical protein